MDKIVDTLHGAAAEWVSTAEKERMELLKRAKKRLGEVDWVAMGQGDARVEGFDTSTKKGANFASVRGMGDNMVTKSLFDIFINHHKKSTERQWEGQTVLSVKGSWTAPGYELWLKPDVPRKPQTLHSEPRVGLVLGAGNQTFLALSDALAMLHTENSTCIVKVHPLRAYTQPIFEFVMREYIDRGFFAMVACDMPQTQALIANAKVRLVHLTGGKATHDAIVWGRGDEAEARRKRGEPLLTKPMTSELGCITPYIIASGAVWTKAQLEYQAKCLVGPLMYNASCNCLAPKLLVLDADWPQHDGYLAALRAELDAQDIVPAYYPGAGDRYDRHLAAYKDDKEAKVSQLGGAKATKDTGYLPDACVKKFLLVELIEGHLVSNPYAFKNEPFAPVLTVLSLKGGNDTAAFLSKATTIANEQLFGTLSATLILHPDTDKAAGEKAVAALEYGSVVVNGWSALGHANYWGGHPKEKLEAVESGLGFVNALLDVDRDCVEKSVTRLTFKSSFQKMQMPMPIPSLSQGLMAQIVRFMAKPSVGTFVPFVWEIPRAVAVVLVGGVAAAAYWYMM